MALKKLRLLVRESHRGQRLDQVLAQWLPEALGKPVSKAKVRKLIVAGAVYLNHKRVRIASKELLPGATIEAFVDPARLLDDAASKQAEAPPFEMTDARVLFEDEWLLVVDKPAGLPTQPTLDEARDNLFASAKRYLVRREKDPEAYLGLHHRLDRDTSGVLLLTKKKEANTGVSKLFTGHGARKVYQALTVVGPHDWAQAWSVKNHLGKIPGPGKRARFGAVRSGGDPAHTDFELLDRASGAWRVEARPLTGRTHQIRVHLAEGGLPILGDPHYGGPTRRGGIEIPRVMLHAASLSFEHPITGQAMKIESTVPKDFLDCWERVNRSGGA